MQQQNNKKPTSKLHSLGEFWENLDSGADSPQGVTQPIFGDR